MVGKPRLICFLACSFPIQVKGPPVLFILFFGGGSHRGDEGLFSVYVLVISSPRQVLNVRTVFVGSWFEKPSLSYCVSEFPIGEKVPMCVHITGFT